MRRYDVDAEDEAYAKHRQQLVDDEAEARAMHIALMAAADEGRSAGMLGHGASMNPYPQADARYVEWEKCRAFTLGERFNGKTRRTA